MNHFQSFILRLTNMLYSFGMLMCALFLTWTLLSKADFFYPTLHQVLDIQETVERFGPENRYRKGFEHTTAEQHINYFSEIVVAINNDGQGLKEITYSFKDKEIRLLRKPEIVHLEDVATLLNSLSAFSLIMMIVIILILAHRYYQKSALPTVKSQLLQLVILVGSLMLISAFIGFKAVFYWLHHVAFPAENEWFFYYQDSLMTTMMKAPILFAPISAFIVIGACLLFWLLNVLISKGYQRLLTTK